MRTRYDHFGKQLLRQALAPGGAVETDAEVPAETGRIDLWFWPDPTGHPRIDLGLLGQLLHGPRTVELYHCTPSGEELTHAVVRHGLFRHVLALREPAPPMPVQLVITSGRPDTGLAGLGFHPRAGGPLGLYDGPRLLWTSVCVVSELVPTRETLLLRLLGAGRVLRSALAEIEALPADAPERALALPILLRLRFEVPVDPAKRTIDDQEFLMDTQDVLEKFRRDAVREGKAQGLLESLIDAYEARFGALPTELRSAIEATVDEASLRSWHKLAITGSADELAAAVRASQAS